MIGRVPMMPPPGFAPALPPGGFAPPGFGPAQAFAPGPMTAPAYPVAQPPGPLVPSFTQQQRSPQPRVIRGQAPEEPPPAARPVMPEPRSQQLRLPTPEELGVSAPPPVPVRVQDAAAAPERLDQLGTTCLHLERLAQGGCRLTCLLSTGQEGRSHRIDVQAASAAEALSLAVDQAETWARGRK